MNEITPPINLKDLVNQSRKIYPDQIYRTKESLDIDIEKKRGSKILTSPNSDYTIIIPRKRKGI